MYPSSPSMILVRLFMIVVLPAPDLPTIPIFSPSSILSEIWLRTRGRPSLYLAEYYLN
jgi:hypothetical protein